MGFYLLVPGFAFVALILTFAIILLAMPGALLRIRKYGGIFPPLIACIGFIMFYLNVGRVWGFILMFFGALVTFANM